MENFSVYNFENLTDSQKNAFKKFLANKLSSFMSEIKKDDVLCSLAIEEFVALNGVNEKSDVLVAQIYSMISGGIQVGSGNQNLFQGVLNAFVEAWKELNK